MSSAGNSQQSQQQQQQHNKIRCTCLILLNVIVLVALSMNTLDQSLRISTWASMGSLGSLGPNDDADGDHDYDGKSTSSRSNAMSATRQGQPTALKPRQSQSLLLQQQTRDAEAETMTTTPIGTSTTMENFKPEQGLESIPCRTTDVLTVQEHLEYYFGEGGPNSTHNTNQSTSAPSLIFFITPTYKRVTQMADLLRLSYTLDHDRAVYWIVVEDSNTCSKRVRDLLDRSGILYAHLAIKSPPKIQKLKGPSPPQAKGVAQRNAALDVVESLGLEGVLYFGDDDNAYDVRMFPELRRTKRVGVFGVAYAGGGTYERCIVDPKTKKVSGFVTRWDGGRKFPVDMGGLSFHTSVILTDKRPRFSLKWELGFLETLFIQLFVTSKEELEPLMDDCQTMYVWHVTTKYPYEKQHGLPYSMAGKDPMHSKILPSV